MKIDPGELESIIGAEITDAISYIDSTIGKERTRATEYYRGELFGDEDEGRSQVVSRDVHDVVNAILPSLMRIFFGPDRVVEFVPQGEEDVQNADQATDYINYVVTRDNPGFEILYAAIKDALIRKCGIIKWWWDEAIEVTTQEYTGLDENGLTVLIEDLQKAQKAELVSSSEDENGLSVTIKLTKSTDRARLECVPPEEFLISRDARTIDDARFVGHRCMKTVSQLVAMGYNRAEVEEHAGDGDEMRGNSERLARNPGVSVFGQGGISPDASAKLVLYVEGNLRVDTDGDGIAELVRICTIGPNHRIVHQEPITDVCFAAFHPDPEPHTFFGDCPAEKVMDIQRIKSVLLRNALDGLSLAIFPRMRVGRGGNIEAAMNTEIGAILPGEAGDYEAFILPDTSKNAYAALTYMDEIKENRTGISKVSQGLDPKALQNATATAAAAQFSQAQQHIELIARIFAETGMKKLFRGLLKLVAANQRKERMVQLRNRWVPVDPRAWRVDMDVTSNVALGAGTPQDQITGLNLIASKQEQVLLTAGPNNPLVTLKNLHETYTQLTQRMGFKNPDAFFSDPDSPEVQERMANAPPPPPDPRVAESQAKMQLAQAEGQGKLELAHATAQSDAQLQQAKAQSDMQIAMRRMEIEGELKREQLTAELGLKREQLTAELDLKRELAYAELDLKREQIAMGAATDLHGINVDAEVASSVHTGGEPG